jgi:hypothetical protein
MASHYDEFVLVYVMFFPHAHLKNCPHVERLQLMHIKLLD